MQQLLPRGLDCPKHGLDCPGGEYPEDRGQVQWLTASGVGLNTSRLRKSGMVIRPHMTSLFPQSCLKITAVSTEIRISHLSSAPSPNGHLQPTRRSNEAFSLLWLLLSPHPSSCS